MMNILFLCVANSARSQMAEGLARQILGNDVVVMSAGSNPTIVSPLAIQVMDEISVDVSSQFSKSIDTIDLTDVDKIITLCADEICPHVESNISKEHWPLPDPAVPCKNQKQQLEQFRYIRDKLKCKILALKQEIQTTKS